MQGKEWLWYILDSTGKSYRIENGLVVAKTSPKPLTYTPDGWQDLLIGWERNITKWGVNRNFSLPIGFVIDGADILMHLNYTGNFERQLYLLIQKQELVISPTNYYFWHKFFYRGELDLTTFKRSENKVTVNIMEGGLSKDLKANENTTFEIPVDELVIRMDGIPLFNTAEWVTINEGFFANPGGAGAFVYGWLSMSFLNSEGTNFSLEYSTQNTEHHDSNTNNDDGGFPDNWFAKGKDTTTFDLTFTLNAQLVNYLSFTLYVKNSNGTRTTLYTRTNGSPGPPITEDVVINVDQSISVAADETLSLICKLEDDPFGSGPATVIFTETNIPIDFGSTYRTTYIRAVKPETLYKRLIGKVTGDEADGQSDLLAGKPNLAVTSGDAIRGFANAKIKTSINDFTTSFNVILNAGIGIENDKIRFEEKAHFFDDTDIIALGQVKDYNDYWATELLYNSLKIGYPNQDYEDVNGRQEFNTTQVRSTVIKRITKTLELISKYRADMYGIEFTRINLDGKQTTDDGADNDTFIINIDYDNPQTLAEPADGFPAGTTYYNLKRETYDSISGLLAADSAFNIEELTPARLIKKHENYFNSIFYGFEGTKIKFETIDKNPDLVTELAGVTYDENADVDIASTPRLFKPYIFEFTPETPTDLVELLQYNPNRCFSFVHPNGNTYKGFNMKVGIAPNTLQEQVFQLLSHPDNDLTTLQ